MLSEKPAIVVVVVVAQLLLKYNCCYWLLLALVSLCLSLSYHSTWLRPPTIEPILNILNILNILSILNILDILDILNILSISSILSIRNNNKRNRYQLPLLSVPRHLQSADQSLVCYPASCWIASRQTVSLDSSIFSGEIIQMAALFAGKLQFTTGNKLFIYWCQS